jgi:NADH:ubiquinone oxidoreductase subunit 5 (subunit L)/multisubunit Na+/H+ antiporter MnhA subunit
VLDITERELVARIGHLKMPGDDFAADIGAARARASRFTSHLMTHAFFKALLFLGAGSVIHALGGEQDMRHMGGLRTKIPWTFWTMTAGTFAIAGIPPLAGFFSKDEILFYTFYNGHQWMWVVGVLTSLLTAVYMWRLVHLTFHGTPRFAVAAHGPHSGDPHDAPEPAHTHQAHQAHQAHHTHPAKPAHPAHPAHPATPHDAPMPMAIALVLLAIGSAVAGFIGIPHALGGHNVLGEWLAPVVGAHAQGQPGGPQPESVGVPFAGMTIPGDCVVNADPAAAQLPGMTTENCAPAGDVALAANVVNGAGLASSDVSGAAGLDSSDVRGAGLQPGQVVARVQPAAAGAQPAVEAAEDEHAKEALELQLMTLSSIVAIIGVGVAWFIWLKRPEIAAGMAVRFPGLHRLLLNKYYVDELYDVTIVQPVKIVSEDGLWRGMDARVIDGAVNGAGHVVGGMSAVMRLFQSGSVKAYAASTFLGVVLILAYYIWR